ncbi:putative membrane protein, partial [Yersinia pestis PY-56]
KLIHILLEWFNLFLISFCCFILLIFNDYLILFGVLFKKLLK